jgi:hypothetical protein
MNMLKRILVTAAGVAMATGLMAGVANASTTMSPWPGPPWSTTAWTWVPNLSVPGHGGAWASETVLRTATVSGGYPVPSRRCGEATGPCFGYTATLRDDGSFRTYRHALTPNQDRRGQRITSVVTGDVSANVSFSTFYATARPSASLVPKRYYGGFTAAATWPELFFPHGTTFAKVKADPWKLTYSASTACGTQRWTDASDNGHGDLWWDGNITGCFSYRHHWWA